MPGLVRESTGKSLSALIIGRLDSSIIPTNFVGGSYIFLVEHRVITAKVISGNAQGFCQF